MTDTILHVKYHYESINCFIHYLQGKQHIIISLENNDLLQMELTKI